MRVGVALPNVIPAATPDLIEGWARLADEGPFSTLAVLDRLAYESYEPFLSLAFAASITQRIGLATTVAIGPLRPVGLLAKQAVTLQSLSRGRLTLGLAVGARTEDYALAGVEPRERGRKLDQQLASLHRYWEADRFWPAAEPDGGATGMDAAPPVLIGGTASDQAFARVARYASGYIHGGGPVSAFASAADRARTAWQDAERPGEPQLWGQGYFALGDPDAGAAYMKDYYAFTGPFADRLAAELLTTPQAIKQYIRSYEDAGCDELILVPSVADIADLEQLASLLTGI